MFLTFNECGVSMSKLMSCRIVFALLFVFATVPAFAGGELLTNPGFEDGDLGQFGTVTIPGWSTTRTDGFHHDESGNVIDAKALKSSNSDTAVKQDFPVVAGNFSRVCYWSASPHVKNQQRNRKPTTRSLSWA